LSSQYGFWVEIVVWMGSQEVWLSVRLVLW